MGRELAIEDDGGSRLARGQRQGAAEHAAAAGDDRCLSQCQRACPGSLNHHHLDVLQGLGALDGVNDLVQAVAGRDQG
jgi:hypothetical protein